MLFRQIPKKLLIHEAIYQPPSNENDGSMGSGERPRPVNLKFVRFTPARKKVIKSDNTEVLVNGALFIDAVNSEPFIIPDEDGEIIFNGSRLSIVEVKTLYTDQPTPHHIEVMLQ